MKITEFRLTKHAIHRLSERCTEFIKLTKQDEPGIQIIKRAYEYISAATEDNGFFNNTLFVQKLYYKYGFDKQFKFFVLDKIICVGIIDERNKLIVTILDKKSHTTPQIRNISKNWKSKTKDKEIINDKFNDPTITHYRRGRK